MNFLLLNTSHYIKREDSKIQSGAQQPPQAEVEALKKSPWIHAWSDPVAGIFAYTGCMCLADLDDDGEHKLILADTINKKLKIYKGVNLHFETGLADNPSAIDFFYSSPKKPCKNSLIKFLSHSLHCSFMWLCNLHFLQI